jgi:cobalt-zinc-cadmium efflux system outer membrane protein
MRNTLITATFLAIFLFLTIPVSSIFAQSEGETLKLDQLIEEALSNNPELKAARERADAYRERPSQVSSLEDPRVTLGFSNLPVDDFDFNKQDMTQKVVSLSQEIPLPGVLSLKKENATQEAYAMERRAKELELVLMKRVKKTYYNLYFANQAIAITEANRNLLERFAEITETKYSVGRGIQQDVLKAQVELSKMVEKIINLEQKEATIKAELNTLLNRPPEISLLEPPDIKKTNFTYSAEELQGMAEEARPALKDVEHLIKSREAAYKLAKKDYLPSLTFTASYGQRDNRLRSRPVRATVTPIGGESQDVTVLSATDRDRPDFFSFLVGFKVPIWFHSKQSRKVRENLTLVSEAKSRYEALKNEIFFDIKDVLEREKRGAKLIELYQKDIIPQAKASLDSAMAAYEVGSVDFITLLNNQLTLFNYRLSYYQVLTDYEKDLAELEAVVGKKLF